MGLTTRDESPPTRAAPDPRELALRQSTDYRLLIGGGGHRRRYGSNRSVFSEDRSPVRPRRCRVRRGVKRYRTRRSLSGSPRVSTKRRRSLPPIARRFNAGYTSSSESDEEPMEEVSYIDRTIAGNYPLRSVMKIFSIIRYQRSMSFTLG